MDQLVIFLKELYLTRQVIFLDLFYFCFTTKATVSLLLYL